MGIEIGNKRKLDISSLIRSLLIYNCGFNRTLLLNYTSSRAATIVNVAPTLVQTLGLPDLYDTGRPELAVAATVKLVLTNAFAGAGCVTVIV
jgi:hypothetical protein